MTKTVTPHLTADIAQKKAKTTNDALNPKSIFVGTALSMSWQLALVVLLFVIGGHLIDQHFKTQPVFTITGFILAMIGTILIIKKALNYFNNTITPTDKTK